jgi:hypothetical protein
VSGAAGSRAHRRGVNMRAFEPSVAGSAVCRKHGDAEFCEPCNAAVVSLDSRKPACGVQIRINRQPIRERHFRKQREIRGVRGAMFGQRTELLVHRVGARVELENGDLHIEII